MENNITKKHLNLSKMKYELIKTENYLLVVSDEEIKDGDGVLFDGTAIVGLAMNGFVQSEDDKKIIAHLPLNNAPYLDGVDVLPDFEDEVSKIESDAMNDYIKAKNNQDKCIGFIDGYNKAKETYKYTEDDLRRAFNAGLMNKYSRTGEAVAETEFIQSLNQPKLPIAFVCETEKKLVMNLGIDVFNPNSHIYLNQPKTITNSEERTEWVGKYEF